MKLALNLILVCSLSLLVVGKKRNGNMKGGLQMTNVAVSGNDMCGTNNKCNADQTHVVCMRIDGEFWTTTEQSEGIDPSLNEPHYHCICVGALTFYLDKKGGSRVAAPRSVRFLGISEGLSGPGGSNGGSTAIT